MRHLELFENKEHKRFWLFDYFIKESNSHTYKLYPDKESCEIAIITIINEERLGTEGNRYTEDMYFTEIGEAQDWYEQNYNDVVIDYYELTLSKKLTPGPKLKMMRNAKKYNL